MNLLDIKEKDDSYSITFILDNSEWLKITNKTLKEIAKNQKINGFRTNSPSAINLIKSKISKDVLYKESERNAFEFILNNFFKSPDYINDFKNKISKDIKEKNVENVSDNEFKATIEFLKPPIITLCDYKNLDIKKIDYNTATEKEIDDYIKQKIDAHSILVPKENKTIESGDVVIFDFTGYIDGKPLENASASNYELLIGSNSFIPTFEDQMINLKLNEKKSIYVTFPKDYHEEKIRNKKVKFDLKINDIKQSKKPELTDEFVSNLKIENVKTVSDFRNHAIEKIKTNKKDQYHRDLQAIIPKEIIKNSKASYVENEKLLKNYDKLYHFNVEYIEKIGIKLKDYLKIINKTEEDFKNQIFVSAREYTLLSYFYDEIAKLEKIDVADNDILNVFKDKLPEEQYNNFIEGFNQESETDKAKILDELKKDIIREKVVEQLISFYI